MSSDILDDILESKQREVEALKELRSPSKLRDRAKQHVSERSLPSFQQALSGDELSLIAEIKPKAPSSGRLTDMGAVEIARVYETEVPAAVSVLTDEPYFGQDIEALEDVKSVLRKPLLRKDFIIDPVQIYRARLYGASAVLLIASVLSPDQIEEFQAIAHELGMGALVEVHSASEIDGLNSMPDILGINNRSLEGDFSTDLSVTENLMVEVPQDTTLISESGINTSDDVQFMRRLDGVDAVLVGTRLVDGAESPDDVRDNIRTIWDL